MSGLYPEEEPEESNDKTNRKRRVPVRAHCGEEYALGTGSWILSHHDQALSENEDIPALQIVRNELDPETAEFEDGDIVAMVEIEPDQESFKVEIPPDTTKTLEPEVHPLLLRT